MSDGELSYEFFHPPGERRGGSAAPWRKLTSLVTPVFHSEDGGRSKPGFSFLFHDFKVIDSRHISEEELAALEHAVENKS
jgi:hypothetical protein